MQKNIVLSLTNKWTGRKIMYPRTWHTEEDYAKNPPPVSYTDGKNWIAEKIVILT